MVCASCTAAAHLRAQINKKTDAHNTIEANLSVFSSVPVDLVRVVGFRDAFFTALAFHIPTALTELLW